MNRSRWVVAGVLVAVGLAAVVAARPWTWGHRRPNVLIVLWDTTRADRMSLYGYPKPTTPRLDAFAKDAAVYENATAPGMWTLASHAAIFTGLFESSHGAKPAHRWLDDHFTTFAETLRDSGYDTFLYSSNLIASPMTHLDQGFDTVETSFPRQGVRQGRYQRAAKLATKKKLIQRDASTEISPAFAGRNVDLWDKAVFKDSAPVAHQALMDWLGERPQQDHPFLAYLNLMEAHSPRIPSLSARRRVADDSVIATAFATDDSLFAANEYTAGVRALSPDQLAGIGATYDAALVDLDDATGDLLDDLGARGILDDTVVIVVADHGESLGEHGRLEHRWSMYDPLLHVPMVIRYPRSFPAGRVQERVSTVDLYATVLQVAGLKPPGPVVSTSLVGRRKYDETVFSQMLDPFASQLASVEELHPELVGGPRLAELVRTYCAVYQGTKKLLYTSDGAHELYDLAADPGETHNLYPTGAEPLANALTTFEAGLPKYDPALRNDADRPKEDAGAEQTEILKLLGYAEGDEQPLRDFCTR